MALPSVREATSDDAAAIRAIYAPFVTDSAISFESEVPTVDEMARRVAATQTHCPWLVVEADGSVVGYAYAGLHRQRPAYRWSVETSAYLAPAARRQGLARRAYEVLFELLALQGFVMAYAGISLPNPASVGFHEALGFAKVGVYPAVGFKHGVWHDVGWWSRALRTPPSTPEVPRSPAAMRRTERWRQALRA